MDICHSALTPKTLQQFSCTKHPHTARAAAKLNDVVSSPTLFHRSKREKSSTTASFPSLQSLTFHEGVVLVREGGFDGSYDGTKVLKLL